MATRPELLQKWAPILEAEGVSKITDQYRKEVTAQLLENQEKAMAESAQALFEATSIPNAGGSGIALGGAGTNANMAGYDPVLISLVRRAAPQMIAYDICGVQPMTQPTGLIFAMKSKYESQAGDEALFNEADTGFAGTGSHPAGTGMTTANAEDLGENVDFGQMAFSIERTSVVAKTRALRAEYTVELAQDLKAVHGLDAEGELSNILSTEISQEINREVVRTMYSAAKAGAAYGTAVAGTFNLDVDANGRWSVEKFKGLMFQIEREANAIAKETRRGRGNFIVTSADVASALAMAGVLDYTPALSTGLNVDEASTTFAGVLNGKYRVYVDPYFSTSNADNFFLVGYKGTSAFDAGMFYCPYVPLEKVRAVDPTTFQPKIGFKTRYGMVANPFTSLSAGQNTYYRKVTVSNLM
jgi:Major capsid protein Gp23